MNQHFGSFKKKNQIVLSDFQKIPLHGKSQVHKNVFSLLPCMEERGGNKTYPCRLTCTKDKWTGKPENREVVSKRVDGRIG